MDLSKYKRLEMFVRPTPLHELPRLQKVINCKPRIFIKRDDLTGVGLGGNKTRKLCYVFPEALEQRADVILTWAGVQSNHCRQTLAMARQLGMQCHLILEGDRPKKFQGNTLVFSLLGAKIHFIGDGGDGEKETKRIAENLRSSGKNPFVVPIGASKPPGTLGYVEAVKEIAKQADELGLTFNHAFLASGSGGTQAGAEVGARELYPSMRIHGVSVSRVKEEQQLLTASLVNDTYKFLNINKKISSKEISIFDQYYGDGYAVPTKEGITAIKLIGKTEGLLLDPVYTGKAMAGMLDLLNRGFFSASEAVVFFHTGGFPVNFSLGEIFQA